MKSRKQKLKEYDEKYNEIPIGYNERLKWMCEKYNISDKKMNEIISIRQEMMNLLSYNTLFIVLYEEPEGSPRPRFRIVNRSNLANTAIANPNFVHVYSPTGSQDNNYMKRLIGDELINIDNIISTPSIVTFNAFFKTPSYFNISEKFLAEIGTINPINKPDWDNIGKKYSDMFNSNIWLDDAMTISGTVNKFYSLLPRVEITLHSLNILQSKHQYNSIIKRKDFNGEINYFNGGKL